MLWQGLARITRNFELQISKEEEEDLQEENLSLQVKKKKEVISSRKSTSLGFYIDVWVIWSGTKFSIISRCIRFLCFHSLKSSASLSLSRTASSALILPNGSWYQPFEHVERLKSSKWCSPVQDVHCAHVTPACITKAASTPDALQLAISWE